VTSFAFVFMRDNKLVAEVEKRSNKQTNIHTNDVSCHFNTLRSGFKRRKQTRELHSMK
jgi:hypothetical protein